MGIRGQSDQPIPGDQEGDLLGVRRYYEGLARFVENCETPMTVAIQGDWGTGKTSAMNSVGEIVKNQIHVVKFETWQYAQLNMGEMLVFSLMRRLAESLEGADKAERDRYVGLVKSIAKNVGWASVRMFAATFGAGPAVEAAQQSVERSSDRAAEDADPGKQIQELRHAFAKIVSDHNKKRQTDRVLFLIDDLDRLPPTQAVEVMEVLKVFLECEGCVFILAIDFDIVVQGVSSRYSTVGNKKARAFFDKIIQVPFNLPVASYDFGEMLERQLSRRESLRASADPQDREQLARFVRLGLGNNPRALKRVLNTFDLLRSIDRGETEATHRGGDAVLQFALLCVQVAYPSYYDRLSSASDGDLAELFPEEGHDDLASRCRIDANEMEGFVEVVVALRDLLYAEEGVRFGELRAALTQTAVTSTGTAPRRQRGLLTDDADRYAHAKTWCGTATVDLLRRLEEVFLASRDGILFRAASNSPAWTLYVDVAGREQKFAEIGLKKESLALRFGKNLRGDAQNGQEARSTESFEKIAEELTSRSAHVEVRRRSSGAPNVFEVRKISTMSDVDLIGQFAASIVEAFMESAS